MTDAFDEGVPIGNPAGFIAESIRNGLSGNQAIAEFRAAGGAMRNEYFRQLYGEITDAIARAPAAAALDPFSIPNASDYGTWSMGRGGEFVTQVNVLFRDVDTGLIGSKPFTYKTDYAHTPEEAKAAAWTEYNDPDNSSEYAQVMYGTVAIGVYQTIAWNG